MSIDVLFSVVEVIVDSAWSPAPRRTPFRSLDAVSGETPMRNPIDALSPVRPGCRQYFASVLVVLFAAVALLSVRPAMAQQSSPPTGLTATSMGPSNPTEVQLTWNVTPGASSYNVYRGPTSGSEGNNPVVTNASVTADGTQMVSYIDTGLTSGSTYYYGERADIRVMPKK